MEILQTIWNALTTENELGVVIISIPLAFIESFVTTLLFTTILNIQSTKKQRIIYILIFSIIALIAIYFIPTPFNTIINIIACPILVYFTFKTSILKSILAEIIPYMAFVFISYILMVGIPGNLVLNIPIYKLCFSLVMYCIVYLIYLIFKNLNYKISISELINEKKHINILISLIVGIIAIIFEACILGIYKESLPPILTFCSLSVLLLYFLFNLYSLLRTNKLEKATQDLENEKLYNKTITILYDNIRDFRHNFNNIVQALGGYISNNNMEGLKAYYKDVLNASQSSNNLAVLNPELINNPAIYSILSSKYYKAEEQDIKMNFEIFLDLQNLNIKIYDLTLILGILLDNAIEAAKESNEKIINVIIRKDNKASRDLFIIENSYVNKDVDVDRIFEKGYTSKKDEDNQSHGLGLWNVRKILRKNNNLNLFTSKDSKMFKQQLEIYS